MTEPGDRVLVLDNGIYGKGFADFVSMYGGCPELYSRDYRETLDVQELANNRTYSLSWNMEYTGDWWLWTFTEVVNFFETTKY